MKKKPKDRQNIFMRMVFCDRMVFVVIFREMDKT